MNNKYADILERFDREWKNGSRPNLSEFLRQAEHTEIPQLTRELLELDLRHRVDRGEHPTRDDYRLIFSFADFDWSILFEQALTKAASTRGIVNFDTSVSQDLTQAYKARKLTDFQVPERIGRYRLERILGKGTFGVVYAAWDETLQRSVAIKLPLVARSNAKTGQLLEEARLVAALSHSSILPIFDCGCLEDGRYFLVYEIMTGGTLSEELLRGRMTVARAVEVATAIAEGLRFAHLAGIYHRDLKTRNVLLTTDGQPKISDFGLAIHENVLADHRDVIAGSPAYMSPEQVRGDSHLLDGRADIWSLGVIFYEMLSGQRPFRSDNIAHLFESIEKKDPRPPRQFDAGIHKELERICLKCLQKSPSDRYLVAADLVSDLSRWQFPATVSKITSQTEDQTTKAAPFELESRRSRHRLTLPGLAVLLTLGVAIVVSATFPGLVTNQSSSETSPDLEKMAGERRIDTSVPPPAVPGEWRPLLRSAVAVLAQPDDMQGTEWSLNEAGDSLAVTTNHTLLFKFDETEAANLDLRLRFRQANWTGGIGVFWNGAQHAGLGGSRPWQFQTIMSPPLMPGDKDRSLRLSWRRVYLLRNALFGQVDIWRAIKLEIPLHTDHELLVQIRNHRVTDVDWDGEQLNDLVELPENFPDHVTSQPGAVGLILSKTQLVVQEFSLRILE